MFSIFPYNFRYFFAKFLKNSQKTSSTFNRNFFMVSWITWTSVSKFQPHSSHFNEENNQKLHSARSGVCGGCFITTMFWCSSHSHTRALSCGQARLNEKSTVEEILVVSTRYDQEVFPVTTCNTPYLSTFWRASFNNRRRWPTSLCLLTFADEPFSSCIRHYGDMPLTRISF